MAGARWIAGTVIAAVSLMTAGCGSGENESVAVRTLAIVVPADVHDHGWSEQGVRGARAVADELGIRVDVTSGAGDGDVTGALEQAAGEDTLVVAHGRTYGAAAAAVAARAGVPVLVFGEPDRIAAGQVGDVEVASEQGGYLAGYIAARASYVRSVGVVVAEDDPSWYRTAGGFIAGARRFDPRVKIRYTRVGANFGDDVGASQRAAKRQIAGGTQMVLGLGDRSTLGVMRAAELALDGVGQPRFDAMFIDVVGDKARNGRASITGLTAITWDFEPAYAQAIDDLAAGTFGERAYTLDLANGGVTVIAGGRTPSDGYEAALKLGDQIEDGKIDVPVTTTDADVRRLLREG